jgi:3-dehydroquinate synthetase/shikimate kinase
MTTSRLCPLVPPVVLLGPAGAGKSTAGALLAARIGFRFIDLDDLVDVGLLVHAGEIEFRLREVAALQSALTEGAVVIAAGAGIVTTAQARTLLARCLCLLLEVDVDTALSRIADRTRPWLPDRGDDPWSPARRQAWLKRDEGRPALRAPLARVVVSGAAPLASVVDKLERAVWSAPLATMDDESPLALSSVVDGFVIADTVVAARLPRVDFVVTDAARKDVLRLFELSQALVRAGVDRSGRIVVVGGGALLDVGGLAAALHHRGTPWIAVPTTLLAMVDAALGGKTAVDIDVDGLVVRNAAGTFFEPVSVVLDRTFLATLSSAQLRYGRAEMLKHALLAGDEDAGLSVVHAAIDEPLVRRSRAIKRFVVRCDPQEKWLRFCLNLGHTFAHALEARFSLAHGDAVLHGLRFALHASEHLCGLDPAYARAAVKTIQGLGPLALPSFAHDDVDALVMSMRRDKKTRGRCRLVLLSAPGRPVLAEVDDEVVRATLTGATR